MVSGIGSEGSLLVLQGGNFIPVKVQVFRCEDPIDIAVLVPPKQLTVSFELEPNLAGVAAGQEIYFAGFPYGQSLNQAFVENGYPLPFLKKGILSAMAASNEVVRIFLDGHNNPGFSGGPIVFRDFSKSSLVFKVGGVISGFRPDLIPVMKPIEVESGQDTSREDQWRVLKLKNGHTAVLKDTDEMVASNSGIVIGYSIKHAVDLIHQHPIGPLVSEKFSEGK